MYFNARLFFKYKWWKRGSQIISLFAKLSMIHNFVETCCTQLYNFMECWKLGPFIIAQNPMADLCKKMSETVAKVIIKCQTWVNTCSEYYETFKFWINFVNIGHHYWHMYMSITAVSLLTSRMMIKLVRFISGFISMFKFYYNA